MNNTDKLLRAFIEASGFDVEELSNGNSELVKAFWDRPAIIKEGIDYKVTKRKVFDYKRHDEKVNLKIRLDVPLCKKPDDKVQDMVTMCEILIKHNMTCLDFVMEVGGKV